MKSLRSNLTFTELRLVDNLISDLEKNNKAVGELQDESKEILALLNKYVSNYFWFIYSCFGPYRKARQVIADNLKAQDNLLADSREIQNSLMEFYDDN